MFKQYIKDYFTFSRSERRGIIFLVAVILLLLIIPLVHTKFVKKPDRDIKAFRQELESWLASAGKEKSDTLIVNPSDYEDYNKFILFRFNPNNISSDEIRNLDINRKAKYSWIKYLQKGGRFYQKTDLMKIYGIDSLTYQKLESYIDLDSTPLLSHIEDLSNEFRFPININKATQADFEKLKDIGPVLSQRIIKYRKLLGGFNNIKQLSEVFGISDSVLNKNRNILQLDTSLLKKIDINRADFSMLCRHPYISIYDARAIITYRKLHGNFKSINELKINHLVEDSTVLKLVPYLAFQGE